MPTEYNVNEARRIFADSKQYHLNELRGYYNLMVAVFKDTKQIETNGIMISELSKVIQSLKARSQELLRARYWNQYSVAETGRLFNVSRERARKIDADTIEILKENTNYFVVEESIKNIETQINERTKWLYAKRDWLNSIRNRTTFVCDIPIKELIDDNRVINAFEKCGIKTVGQIVYFSEEDFLSVKGLYRAGLEKIVNAMQMKFLGWVPRAKKRKDLATGIQAYGLEDISETFYEVPVEKLNLSVRAYNCLMREGIHTIKDLFETSAEELYRIKALGTKTLHELAVKKEVVFLVSKPIQEQDLIVVSQDEIDAFISSGITNLGEIIFLHDTIQFSDFMANEQINEIRERLICEYL